MTVTFPMVSKNRPKAYATYRHQSMMLITEGLCER